MLDWDSSECLTFANPALPVSFHPKEVLPGHIWIATSGTTASQHAIKWAALSKEAFLISAKAVNTHLQSSASDIWLNPLPLFHVGGLSIHARAYLSGARVEEIKKWSCEAYMEALFQSKATLSSLVPAQAHDLIQANYAAPPHLRALIIGGGALSKEFFEKGKALHWPLMPSFGMTECCSQIATAHLGEYDLTILPHMNCSISPDGFLQIQSHALFTGYLHVTADRSHFEDPKRDGLFTTQDRVKIDNNVIHFLGRASDWIKIGGENVSLFHLETHFNSIKPPSIDAFLKAAHDERLGNVIVLVAVKADGLEKLVQTFNATVMPYEKIRHVQFVDSIPRSPLGKILRSNI